MAQNHLLVQLVKQTPKKDFPVPHAFVLLLQFLEFLSDARDFSECLSQGYSRLSNLFLVKEG